MITALSDFLSDMRDSENMVLVKESKLRAYAQQAQEAILVAGTLRIQRDSALAKIAKLENTIEVLKVMKPVEEIDLFA